MSSWVSRYLPQSVKRYLRPLYRRLQWQTGDRVFCISAQKTGTTSVGEFFASFGYPVATWGVTAANDWTEKWYIGDYEAIFKSFDFWSYQVFEDTPWWAPDFYKVLFHRFPNAKFVLLTRDSKKWFESLRRHAGGKTMGNTRQHCKLYRREQEFFHKLDGDTDFVPKTSEIDNLMTLDGMEDHYRTIYEMRHREIVDFFERHGPNRLFMSSLEDENKWIELGAFFGLDIPVNFQIHKNRQVSNEANESGIGRG